MSTLKTQLLNIDIISNIDIIHFINSNKNKQFIKNVFIKDHECTGIDNIYIGNTNTISSFTNFILI